MKYLHIILFVMPIIVVVWIVEINPGIMSSLKPDSAASVTVTAVEKDKKLKPCCACPETRQARDSWYTILSFVFLYNFISSIFLLYLFIYQSIEIQRASSNDSYC